MSLRAYKVAEAGRYALQGSASLSNAWAQVLGAGIVWGFLRWKGYEITVPDPILGGIVVFLACLGAAWLVIVAVRFGYWLAVEPRKNGKWLGSRFVYTEPALAYSFLARPEDNNLVKHFRFKDAMPGAWIRYKFDIDGSSNHISIHVGNGPYLGGHFGSFADDRSLSWYGKGEFRLNEKRDMYVRFYVKEEADPFQVRIYVTDWDVGDDQQRTISVYDNVQRNAS